MICFSGEKYVSIHTHKTNPARVPNLKHVGGNIHANASCLPPLLLQSVQLGGLTGGESKELHRPPNRPPEDYILKYALYHRVLGCVVPVLTVKIPCLSPSFGAVIGEPTMITW